VRALGLMKPLRWFLLASSVPVLVAFYTCWKDPKYMLDNFAFYVAPQAGWCLFCLVWWAFWGPPRNRGLFFGGIVLADLLLVDLALSKGDGLQWLGYLYFAPAAVVAGDFAGGLVGKLWLKPQLGASPNGGPARHPGNSGVTEGPPSVS
jgi:CDP-diglyceride synthetase